VSQRIKEAERAELHKTIWRIANDLRGSVDGWDFKSYVLGMLFYRFISENLTAYLNEAERQAGHLDFDYRHLSNAEAEFGREETVTSTAPSSGRPSPSATRSWSSCSTPSET
jgi:type I restriction enzyme M protein